jgi:hypothetical protein
LTTSSAAAANVENVAVAVRSAKELITLFFIFHSFGYIMHHK